MATRTTFSGASTEVPWPNTPETPEGFGDNQARHFKTLYDAAAFALTSIGGTADDVTATLDPDLDGSGLVDGMKFSLTWGADNTGPMTLAINSGSPVSILDAAGGTLIAGSARAGARALLEYIGGSFRVLAGGGANGGAQTYFIQIDASTTWTKPDGFDDDAMFTICAWGGGGGGNNSGSGTGGGGGAYAERRVRYADLPSSLTATIGAGGAVNSDGGNTSVGSLLTAFAGTGGGGSIGGGGGGMMSAGNPLTGGMMGGGAGGNGTDGDAATLPYGGGGGGGNNSAGGAAYLGGGGGAGANNANGGISIFGGSGGGTGVAGAIPGGGGGRNAAGGRGRVIIYAG